MDHVFLRKKGSISKPALMNIGGEIYMPLGSL
jgi:hypothetical protein